MFIREELMLLNVKPLEMGIIYSNLLDVVQTEPNVDFRQNRSEVTGVYQQTAKHLLDVRIENQPPRKHPTLIHANSYASIFLLREILFMLLIRSTTKTNDGIPTSTKSPNEDDQFTRSTKLSAYSKLF